MSEQAKKSLLHFMKKQISEKSSKINAEHKLAVSHHKSHDEKNDESKEAKDEEEMTEEEELEETKKESMNKAAELNQAEMMKKLALETFVKYTILVAVCVIFAIGLMQFGPAIAEFFNGVIFKALMATLHN
jgi:lipopolysaccharide export LptBFGC system permease protein LptF